MKPQPLWTYALAWIAAVAAAVLLAFVGPEVSGLFHLAAPDAVPPLAP